MRFRRVKKKMYAVSCKGIGLISGTTAYSRKDAINHLFGGGPAKGEWWKAKQNGYRTVLVRVEVMSN
jgi:hypothetical protein